MKRIILIVLCGLALLACKREKTGNQSQELQNKISDSTAQNVEEKEINDWKGAYLDYMQNLDTTAYKTYATCFIDDDTIPELCLFGTSYADGSIILSQYNKKVSALKCYWSPQYIEKQGLIADGYAHGGTYGNLIYTLQNGTFKLILETKAVWNWEDAFIFYVNGEIVDTIQGNNVEDSCSIIQEQLNKMYYSKGESKALYIEDSF